VTLTSPAAAPIPRSTWMLMAAGMAGAANIRAFDTALPLMSESFGITLGQTGHFAAAYALAYGLCQLPFGILGDRFDKPALIRLLAALSAGIMLLTMFAASYEQMLLLRLVAGGVASAIIPLTISHIGDTVPFAQRQVVLAWNMTAMILGLVLGQIAGGLITDLAGWQFIPLFIAALYLPAIVGLRAGTGAVRHAPPIAPTEALRRIAAAPFSRAVLVVAFLEGAAIFAVSAFFGVALAVRFDLSPGVVGALLTVNALGSVANLVLLRRLPAGWGMQRHFTLGGFAAALGLVVLALSPWLGLALVGLFLAGLGGAAVHNTMQTYASQMLPEARATGFSTFATMFFLSQAVGAAVLAALLDLRGPAEMFLWPVPVLVVMVWWFIRRIATRPAD
jgi:MFS transporter, YNFM family, putative membrane transport protein